MIQLGPRDRHGRHSIILPEWQLAYVASSLDGLPLNGTAYRNSVGITLLLNDPKLAKLNLPAVLPHVKLLQSGAGRDWAAYGVQPLPGPGGLPRRRPAVLATGQKSLFRCNCTSLIREPCHFAPWRKTSGSDQVLYTTEPPADYFGTAIAVEAEDMPADAARFQMRIRTVGLYQLSTFFRCVSPAIARSLALPWFVASHMRLPAGESYDPRQALRDAWLIAYGSESLKLDPVVLMANGVVSRRFHYRDKAYRTLAYVARQAGLVQSYHADPELVTLAYP